MPEFLNHQPYFTGSFDRQEPPVLNFRTFEPSASLGVPNKSCFMKSAARRSDKPSSKTLAASLRGSFLLEHRFKGPSRWYTTVCTSLPGTTVFLKRAIRFVARKNMMKNGDIIDVKQQKIQVLKLRSSELLNIKIQKDNVIWNCVGCLQDASCPADLKQFWNCTKNTRTYFWHH